MNHYREISTFLVLAFCLTLCGCAPHSLGHMDVSGEIYVPAETISAGKALYVTLSDPLPPDLSDTPAFIVAQFCKYLAPMASSVSSGAMAVDAGAALGEARENKSDYLILLHLLEWKAGNMFQLQIGPKVIVEASIFDTATDNLIAQHTIQASCHAMSVGLEMSPRECVRPQVEKWMNQVFFNTEVHTTPHADPTNFPRKGI